MAGRTDRTDSGDTAPQAFDANLPVETRIVTPGGVVRSARIRKNVQHATDVVSPTEPAAPAIPKRKRAVKLKFKPSPEVSSDEESDYSSEEKKKRPAPKKKRTANPKPGKTPATTPKRPAKRTKQVPTTDPPTGPGRNLPVPATSPSKGPGARKGQEKTGKATPTAKTVPDRVVFVARSKDVPEKGARIPPRIPVVKTQTGQPRPNLPGQAGPSKAPLHIPQTTPIVTTQTGLPRPNLPGQPGPSRARVSEDDEDSDDEQDFSLSSSGISITSYTSDTDEEDDEDEDQPLRISALGGVTTKVPGPIPRNRSDRSIAPERELPPQGTIIPTIEDDNQEPTVPIRKGVMHGIHHPIRKLPPIVLYPAESNIRGPIQRGTPFIYPKKIDLVNQGPSKRTMHRPPMPYRIFGDHAKKPGFDTSDLASKRAFWWAHIVWITVCFAAIIFLWTLGLCLYWGNHFATTGPPAPCDMTTSVRPFPQTYAESFKIFRRPDISWDPVVRQQMEEFGNYIGADPWLMDNCILPRNIMKLPLVTCQGRLPWYNLTETQVMWLNENSGWGYSLDWDLTEKFNEIYDMQFELQELQTSWMLSDHGPASIEYRQRRCQACMDVRAAEKDRDKQLISREWWPWTYWRLNSKEQALFRRLMPAKAFQRLKSVLFGVGDNPQVALVDMAGSDVPYYQEPPYVGPDMVLTDTDTRSWQPAN